MELEVGSLENCKPLRIVYREIIDDIGDGQVVEGELIAHRQMDMISLRGTVRSCVKCECVRCLKEGLVEVKVDIEEKFCLREDRKIVESGAVIEIEEFVEYLNGCDTINITDIVYQNIVLNFPNNYVCDINCMVEEDIVRWDCLESNVKLDVNRQDPRLEVFKKILD